MMNRRVPGSAIARVAQRVFHESTYERVVLPALADLQYECTDSAGPLVRARAYWGVLKAIVVCVGGDAVRDRDGHTASLLVRLLVGLSMLVALLMLPNAGLIARFVHTFGMGPAIAASLLLTPASIALAIPGALFFALALHRLAGAQPFSRLWPAAIVSVLACAGVMIAMVAVIVPVGNEAFQNIVRSQLQSQGHNVTMNPGLPELTWPALNDRIRTAPSRRAEEDARAHRQGRIAMVVSVFALAAVGLSLAGRWRSRAATGVVAVALLVLYAFCFSHGWNNGGRPLALWAWSTNAAFFVLGVGLMVSRRDWVERVAP
ncbi:MAG TPA: LptF/LptG family permease [Vicinamibacterales bacterium]|nr:LptF/LptG family permease [Vicinamibacterales bacterium]